MAKLRVRKMAQHENTIHNTAERGERSRERVRRGGVRQPLHDDIGGRRPALERSRRTHQEVRLLVNQIGIREAMKQRIRAPVIGLAVHLIQVLIGQIAPTAA